MLMRDQRLYKSLAIEVYGHCRLLLPWKRVPCWFFFFNPGLKDRWHGWPGIEPTTLDLNSQWGAYDLSAMATPMIPRKDLVSVTDHFQKKTKYRSLDILFSWIKITRKLNLEGRQSAIQLVVRKPYNPSLVRRQCLRLELYLCLKITSKPWTVNIELTY